MTGVAPLHCGRASFQAMFSVGLHFTGRFFSPLTPSPVGPRHAGQLAEIVVVALLVLVILAGAAFALLAVSRLFAGHS